MFHQDKCLIPLVLRMESEARKFTFAHSLKFLTNPAVLKASDLPEETQTRLFELAAQALSTYSVEKDYATFLKKEMDHLYGPTWHVIVGKSFGSYVTHEHGFFCYFYIGELAFLVFKSG